MDDSTLSDRLMQLGLSEKEVDTYLTVLERGEVTASEISDATGVSKRYVYSISEELEERGFVDVDDHVVPTKIRARKPDEVIAGLTDDLAAMGPALSERYSSTEQDIQEFDVIKSRVTVIKRIAKYISEAESEITLSISYDHLPEVLDELQEAVDSDVLTMVLVSNVPEENIDELSGIGTIVRTWNQATPLLLTVDQQYGVVAPVEMVAQSNADQRAIAFAQEQIVPVLVGSFLGNYWPMATEVFVADPRGLPSSYESFRHAVLDATLYLRAEDPVGVEAAVIPRRADLNEEEISGTVIDTNQGLVEPATNNFPVEHSLLVKTNRDTVSIGGPGVLLEDYEAKSVRLVET